MKKKNELKRRKRNHSLCCRCTVFFFLSLFLTFFPPPMCVYLYKVFVKTDDYVWSQKYNRTHVNIFWHDSDNFSSNTATTCVHLIDENRCFVCFLVFFTNFSKLFFVIAVLLYHNRQSLEFIVFLSSTIYITIIRLSSASINNQYIKFRYVRKSFNQDFFVNHHIWY